MRLAAIVRPITMLVACAAVGCVNSNNRGQIEGTKWTSVVQTVQGEQRPDGFYRFEFGTDKSFTYKTGEFTYTGHYSFGTGDEITLSFEKKFGGKSKHNQTFRVRGDAMEVFDSAGTLFKFRKET